MTDLTEQWAALDGLPSGETVMDTYERPVFGAIRGRMADGVAVAWTRQEAMEEAIVAVERVLHVSRVRFHVKDARGRPKSVRGEEILRVDRGVTIEEAMTDERLVVFPPHIVRAAWDLVQADIEQNLLPVAEEMTREHAYQEIARIVGAEAATALLKNL